MQINAKQGIAPVAAIIIGLLVVAGGAYAVKKGVDKKQVKENREKKGIEVGLKDKTARSAQGAIHIKLSEQNNSGQKGEATITQTGTSTVKVIVNLTGKPPSVAQPAHIHLGSCPNPGAVKYPLKAIEKGVTQTELAMTFEQLLSELPLAINVHKSAAEASVYVACGNIEEPAKGGSASGGKNGDAMMQEGEKMMEKKGDGMMKSAESMLQRETVVTYGSRGFSPKTITIEKGEAVLFQNKTGKPSSVASEVHPTHTRYPEFDQYKTDQRGKNEFRFTFEKAGTWGYHDHLNSTMTGTVIVTE